MPDLTRHLPRSRRLRGVALAALLASTALGGFAAI
jgi:hypothetical protein